MPSIPIPPELRGVRHELLPDVPVLSGHDLTDHPLFPDRVTNMYKVPGHSHLLYRRTRLAPNDFTSAKEILDHIAEGLYHYGRLERCGIYVPPHRNIDAVLPIGAAACEGRILSVTPRFKSVTLLDVRRPDHLPASIHMLRGVIDYASEIMADGYPSIMWDIFRSSQYGLVEPTESPAPAPQGVTLLDFGIELAGTAATDHERKTHVSMWHLGALITQVEQVAYNTAFEDQAIMIAGEARSRLPLRERP